MEEIRIAEPCNQNLDYTASTTQLLTVVNYEVSVLIRGKKRYELSNHLGNVMAVVQDRKRAINNTVGNTNIEYYIPYIVETHDYYAYGSLMEGRGFSTESYRFGFQGQEGDDEVAGEGNSYAFKYRIHDARLGRFLSIDPLAHSYPFNSPYAFAMNKVIRYIELEGAEIAEPEAFEQARDNICNKQQELIDDPSKNKDLGGGVSLMDVLNDLENQMADTDNGADGSGTNSAESNNCRSSYFCGKAATQNVVMNYSPVEYVNFITDLAENGKAKFGGRGPTTRLSKKIDFSNTSASYSDHIFAESLERSTRFKGGFNIFLTPGYLFGGSLYNSGTTIPPEMRRVLRHVGLKVQKGSFWGYGNYSVNDLYEMKWGRDNNLLPIYFKGSSANDKFGIHYRTIHGLNIDISGKKIDGLYWDYGSVKPLDMDYNDFLDELRGYWIPVKR